MHKSVQRRTRLSGKSDTERLDDLEILSTHQARQIEDLNEVVTRQTAELDTLRRRLTVMAQRLADMEGDAPPSAERPPHW